MVKKISKIFIVFRVKICSVKFESEIIVQYVRRATNSNSKELDLLAELELELEKHFFENSNSKKFFFDNSN